MKLKQRILIPTQESAGISVADHFGRAPYFAIFDIDSNGKIIEKNVNPNMGGHAGGSGHAHDNVLRLQPNFVIVHGMGPRGISSFESNNVIVLKANSDSIDNVVMAFIKGILRELRDSCSEAHHK